MFSSSIYFQKRADGTSRVSGITLYLLKLVIAEYFKQIKGLQELSGCLAAHLCRRLWLTAALSPGTPGRCWVHSAKKRPEGKHVSCFKKKKKKILFLMPTFENIQVHL